MRETWFSRLIMPQTFDDRFCDLCIVVIAKASRIEKCSRLNSNDMLVGITRMRGINLIDEQM